MRPRALPQYCQHSHVVCGRVCLLVAFVLWCVAIVLASSSLAALDFTHGINNCPNNRLEAPAIESTNNTVPPTACRPTQSLPRCFHSWYVHPTTLHNIWMAVLAAHPVVDASFAIHLWQQLPTWSAVVNSTDSMDMCVDCIHTLAVVLWTRAVCMVAVLLLFPLPAILRPTKLPVVATSAHRNQGRQIDVVGLLYSAWFCWFLAWQGGTTFLQAATLESYCTAFPSALFAVSQASSFIPGVIAVPFMLRFGGAADACPPDPRVFFDLPLVVACSMAVLGTGVVCMTTVASMRRRRP